MKAKMPLIQCLSILRILGLKRYFPKIPVHLKRTGRTALRFLRWTLFTLSGKRGLPLQGMMIPYWTLPEC